MIPALQGLVDAQYLTEQDASDLINGSLTTGRSVSRLLRELGYLNNMADVRIPPGLDHRAVDLVEAEIDPEAIACVPSSLAQRHGVVPVGFEGDRLVLAVPDATNVIAVDDIRTACGRDLEIVLSDETSIAEAWVRQGALDRSAETLLEESVPEDERTEEIEAVEDAPIVRAINQIIAQAVQQRASDMHIEPQEHDVKVRFRLDGVLHEIMRIPRTLHAGVTSRLKIMAELNIAERRVPQDGRISVKIDGHQVDLRVATVPSVWGEEVILRILDHGSSLLSLSDLGFVDDTLEAYETAFRKPYGAILVVGPTGSGKSTTLYSTLSVVRDVTKKIITVEDPVEYRMAGMSQIHVNPKAGLTFATALRSILRSDPDVVMVGEIRDAETARIGIEAALTGHLVFSTLHTNDAPAAMTRLIEMGVEPFLVASAIECVLAQRLARKLCDRCKEPYAPTPEARELCHVDDEEAVLFRAIGCNHCSSTGYRGRVALMELMLVTEEIERLTAERNSSEDIRRTAVEQGMRSLRDDGMMKVREGMTSLEEVLRIVEGRTEERKSKKAVVQMAQRRQIS